MAALRQIAFYGRGGTGKPKRKAQPVTAPIEDRSLGSPSKNEMHFHRRMKVMASMRGGDGFRSARSFKEGKGGFGKADYQDRFRQGPWW
ncbi:hypothetical protein [Sinorhizobium medicae]|uniref:hypothetical protein n=1 Tax=Sinorhizobium medicae TaxID=110321 RepID=UPI001F3D023A|nr:hypothetical protein [Sinorhizobium medicae]